MSLKHLFIEEMAFSSQYSFASSASDPDELSTLGTAIDYGPVSSCSGHRTFLPWRLGPSRTSIVEGSSYENSSHAQKYRKGYKSLSDSRR